METALHFPTTIFSGGESGAERAALDFAVELKVFHGGYCAKGRVAEDGKVPERYDLREAASTEYAERLWLNVSQADATAIFDGLPSARRRPETVLAVAACKRCRQPFMVFSAFPHEEMEMREFRSFVRAYRPSVLYITGNSESQLRGTYSHVKSVLMATVSSMGILPRQASVQNLAANEAGRYLHYPGGIAS